VAVAAGAVLPIPANTKMYSGKAIAAKTAMHITASAHLGRPRLRFASIFLSSIVILFSVTRCALTFLLLSSMPHE
jgi:hypothetical protein